ncbi:MAG: dockerin type I repeat-containing protein [Phycisphaerae bacterium]|nr:dockerin type I repeat-containing protein [Phycisphaerae bacterium]
MNYGLDMTVSAARRQLRGELIAAGFAVLTVIVPARALADTGFLFASPSDDRWHYPFNPLPGTRSVGSTFGTVGDRDFFGNQRFNERDGVLIFGWRTDAQIPTGQGSANYRIKSIKITLKHLANADWPIDTTSDEWYTYDVNADGQINADGIPRGQPGDTDGESDDLDAGRPFELFGAGFNPDGEFFDEATWTETSFFEGWNQEPFVVARNPYPFVYQAGTLEKLHCEDNVSGLHNTDFGVTRFTPIPWAVGVPNNYTPGNQPTPFDVEFDIDLSLSCDEVRRYFQDQLDRGRILVIVTSLSETFMQAGTGFPQFYLNTGVPGQNPYPARLEIVLSDVEPGDIDGDGNVDSADVAAFVSVLLDPDAALAAYRERCDFNGDQTANGADIASFVTTYLGGC